MSKTKNISCHEAESLLISKSRDSIRQIDEKALLQHIETCNDCANLRTAIGQFRMALGNVGKNGLSPNPKTHAFLHSRSKALQQQPAKSVFYSFRKSIHHILNIKVSVYQAALGVAVGVLFFALFQPREIVQGGAVPQNLRLTQSPDSVKHYHHVKDSFDAIFFKSSGQKLEKDTLLARFQGSGG